MNNVHSRRLSATADVNYRDLDQEVPPPLPPKGSVKRKIKGILKKKNSHLKNKPLPAVVDSDGNVIAPGEADTGSQGSSTGSRGNKNKKKVKIMTEISLSDEFEDIDQRDNEDNMDTEGEVLDFEIEDEDFYTPQQGGWRGFLYAVTHPNSETLTIIGCILGWYAFSLTISLYNKWMFAKSNLNLPYPIIITSFHQFILFWLSLLVVYWVPSLRPQKNSNFSIRDLVMERKLYLVSILPCALASSGDIGCGNVSFRYISLSLYTMIKSSSIAFVLIFGVLFKLERLTCNLASIVAVMTVGVMMMVAGSDTDSGSGNNSKNDIALGSVLVLIASCSSGLRWALTQLVLKSNPYITNPVTTILYLSPGMFLTLFVTGCFVEGFGEFLSDSIWAVKGVLQTLLLLLIPGFLVFFMTLFEFRLLQKSHVVTLSIAGIFKELLTILVSSWIFGDTLTFVNCIGLAITLADIVWYNYYRYAEKQQERYAKVSGFDQNEEDEEL